jgi:hypothetical protein
MRFAEFDVMKYDAGIMGLHTSTVTKIASVHPFPDSDLSNAVCMYLKDHKFGHLV